MALGATQSMVGISAPWDVEKMTLKRGQKRKRGGAAGSSSNAALESATITSTQEVDNYNELGRYERRAKNLAPGGTPTIPIRRI